MIPQDVKQYIIEFMSDGREYTIPEIFEYISSFKGSSIVKKSQIRNWLEYESVKLPYGGIFEKNILGGHVFFHI